MNLIRKIKNFGAKICLASSIIFINSCCDKYLHYHYNGKVFGNQTEFYETFLGQIGMKVKDANGTEFNYNFEKNLELNSLIVSNMNNSAYLKKYGHNGTLNDEKVLHLAQQRADSYLTEIKRLKWFKTKGL